MRISGQPPRLVGKPLEGEKGTPEYDRAELLKLEIQRYLQRLGDASDQAQLDIDGLLNGTSGSTAQTLHPFLLFGG